MKIFAFFLLLFIFTFPVFSQKQISKPEDAVKSILLERLKKQKKSTEEELSKLQVSYTNDYPQTKQAKERLDKINEEIQNLILTNPTLELTPDILPNDSIFLLKLIIIQNQQIIKLLKK